MGAGTKPGFDTRRLAAALKDAGVVAPHLETGPLATDAGMRLEVLCCCLSALGPEFLEMDTGVLAHGCAAEREAFAAGALLQLGLVPSEVGDRGGLREPRVETALALIAGELRPADANMKLFDALADVVEVQVYTAGLGVSLDDEYKRCRELEAAVVRSRILQGAAAGRGGVAGIIPSGTTAAEKARARERVVHTPQTAAALAEQQAQLRAEISALEREAAASEATLPAIPPPGEMQGKLAQLNDAVARLVSAGDALGERMHALGLPPHAPHPAADPTVDALTASANAVRAHNHRLAALPDTAAQLQAAFAALASTADSVKGSFGEQTGAPVPDTSWAQDYALL